MSRPLRGRAQSTDSKCGKVPVTVAAYIVLYILRPSLSYAYTHVSLGANRGINKGVADSFAHAL